MVDSADLRDFMRVAVACELVYKCIGEDQLHEVKTRDISASGISFVTPHALQPDDELEINIRPVTRLTPPLYAIARVIRCEPAEQAGEYLVACSIIEHID